MPPNNSSNNFVKTQPQKGCPDEWRRPLQEREQFSVCLNSTQATIICLHTAQRGEWGSERGCWVRNKGLTSSQLAHHLPLTPFLSFTTMASTKMLKLNEKKANACAWVCVCGYVCVLKYASKKAKANGLQSESAASEIRQNEKQNTGYKRQTGGHGRVGVAPSSPAYQNTRTCGVSRTWRFPCLFRCFGSAVYWLSDRQRRYTICKVRWGNRYKAGKRMKYITGGRGQKSSQRKLHSRVLHGKIPFDQFPSTQTIPNNKSLINSYATLYFFLNLR